MSFPRAGLVRLTTALGLTSYLDKEREYVPWSSALSSLAFIGSQLSLKPSYGLYSVSTSAEIYILKIVSPIIPLKIVASDGNSAEYLRETVA